MRLSLLPIVALAGSVLASGDTITAAIDDIANATLALNKTIATWPRTLIGTLPIITKSTELLAEIHKGTKVARASEPLSFDETLQVAQATINLAADVNTTLETVIRAKPDFDRLLLSPVILLNLKLQQDASEDFSSAVIEKVPEELQGNAETLTKGIDDSFVKAIKKYSSLRRR
ncbi:antigenic cell wall [Fusarium albosuccineum]|uniref:Antigenic cell wall n=1 Tax=Fusarium albosuccineum TaxID=1237068 RepID=A0A8H4KKI0_9HYPO|nr:antigenic cell wall [Fusarium albosuccineum]KAF4998316.1 hypothetical protein FDECE_11833 [Fusarium decemcellulare]